MATNPTPSARLAVKVVPGSSRDQIVGWMGDALKIKVMAPPEKGRANEAVVAILADRLGVREDDVKIVAGHSAMTKEVARPELSLNQFLGMACVVGLDLCRADPALEADLRLVGVRLEGDRRRLLGGPRRSTSNHKSEEELDQHCLFLMDDAFVPLAIRESTLPRAIPIHRPRGPGGSGQPNEAF
jgi:uncharacterized protein